MLVTVCYAICVGNPELMFLHGPTGIVHVINHPLFPPASIFQELSQLPYTFSIAVSFLLPPFAIPPYILTSTYLVVCQSTILQRTDLHNFVEWRYLPIKDKDGEGSVDGNPAVAHFVPTNSAFRRLPSKLLLFLFSPFGEHALKKILAYHIVPNYVLHSGSSSST